MFGHWPSHKEYLVLLSDQLTRIPSNTREEYAFAIELFSRLNLDTMPAIIRPLYSSTGRKADQQDIVFRMLILTILTNKTFGKIVHQCRHRPIFQALIGLPANDTVPGLGTLYDFMHRLVPLNEKPQMKKLKKPKKDKSLKKGEKLPEKKKKRTYQLKEKLDKGLSLARSPERPLQLLFRKLAVEPSVACGLLSKSLVVSGDGTCVPTGANAQGVKVCDCRKEGNYYCRCPRRYSDPKATWGRDSHNELYFYGYSAYLLCHHDAVSKTDLPLLLRLYEAARHDSLSAMFALSEFKEIYPDFTMTYFLSDSASDNYPTYDLLEEQKTMPVIPLNDIAKEPLYPGPISYAKGIPICAGNLPMVHNGYCPDRNRIKWRCPAKMRKDCTCPLKEPCSPSNYGRTIYTKPSDDPRLFTIIPRESHRWKTLFKDRSACERINKSLLIDYGIEHSRVRTKHRIYISLTCAAIILHLKAQLKVTQAKRVS